MAKTRLDLLLVAKGLSATRDRARAHILAGHVRVEGVRITKAGAAVADTARIEIDTPDHPWVGRGGLKLDHALTAFGIDVGGKIALDIGASTGGFTDVLLSRGATHVVAIDVGTNQLDWRLRSDPRVTALEGMNARYLDAGDLPEGRRSFEVITADVSFISLRHIFPVIRKLLADNGRAITLVKPQFEAGRDQVGTGGIVRDPAVHAAVIAEISDAALRVGLTRLGLEPSPVTGAEGNQEFLVLFAPVR